MAIPLKNHDIVYFPMPKTACTSLKLLFFHLNENRVFKNYKKNGTLMHIHNAGYGTPYFSDLSHSEHATKTRVTVIRDPISRLLSAYSNRVVFHRELSERRIDTDLAEKLGISPDPSPDEFFLNLEKYRALSTSIKHHTDPATKFLGPSLDYFQKVYPLEKLTDLVDFISEKTSQNLKLGREQTGGQKIYFKDLSKSARKQLALYCMGDYALLNKHYQLPPEVDTLFPGPVERAVCGAH
ncbi:MAG: sulfotransferase family protein [Roseibium sp.]|uniref:sulfotransferase family 2 domain-containing protein n=1 Tax=Roseibium sp. TaxID=1936156 RepID=UPI002615990E|nr:sulfotransferase family 2 domain-containing protein [Roseibium sp.]MCV0424083.1 sulfotransferase family protein [Roseibium sp.]